MEVSMRLMGTQTVCQVKIVSVVKVDLFLLYF